MRNLILMWGLLGAGMIKCRAPSNHIVLLVFGWWSREEQQTKMIVNHFTQLWIVLFSELGCTPTYKKEQQEKKKEKNHYELIFITVHFPYCFEMDGEKLFFIWITATVWATLFWLLRVFQVKNYTQPIQCTIWQQLKLYQIDFNQRWLMTFMKYFLLWWNVGCCAEVLIFVLSCSDYEKL